MPERHKHEDVESTQAEAVKVEGKWVQKKTTVTTSVPVWEELDLYNEDGEIIGKHRVPVMESYEEEEEAEEEEEE